MDSLASVVRSSLMTTLHRLKNAGQAKQEAARIEVENAEDDLVQKTEVAITLMKTVLEDVSYEHLVMAVTLTELTFHPQPEPLKNLNKLAKAQLMFYATATEALSTVQGEINLGAQRGQPIHMLALICIGQSYGTFGNHVQLPDS